MNLFNRINNGLYNLKKIISILEIEFNIAIKGKDNNGACYVISVAEQIHDSYEGLNDVCKKKLYRFICYLKYNMKNINGG